ncbi:Lysine-specific demethylase 8 [Linnemannia zychae]|nr:Lysine-specific demethylase 8 [Linnemannia zychae]
MIKTLASKYTFIASSNGSGITCQNCGQGPFKSLQDAKALLTTIQSSYAQQQQQQQPLTTRAIDDKVHSLIYQADALIDYGREMLHSYPYREVPSHWREFYTDAGILKALALGFSAFRQLDKESSVDSSLEKNLESRRVIDIEPLRLAIAVCDNVLVMAGASGAKRQDLVFELINYFESLIEDSQEHENSESTIRPMLSAKRQKTSTLTESPDSGKEKIRLGEEPIRGSIPEIKFQIPRIHLPTMEEFQQHVHGHGAEGKPIIITGGIDHWPARERWTDLDTICRIAGPDRLVPIEIGSQYTDEQWTQKLVTMRDFIQTYLMGQSNSNVGEDERDNEGRADQTTDIGYLAQHDLFAQIPRLRRDIDIPDYCLVSPNEQEGYNPPDDVLLNAWFGPQGTVSPMHTDPYHNLLAQVVGRKYIRLYAPSETAKLYCYGGDVSQNEQEQEGASNNMLSNTSQVNVEKPDLERHPRFVEAEYVEAILAPGELLYIPFQWWHYIRSLSTSFSVSFWF